MQDVPLPDLGRSQQMISPEQAKQVLCLAENRLKEAEALLLVIDVILGELKQPLTVILCLSDLLLTQVDHNHPLASDLMMLNKHIKRISEIVRSTNAIRQKSLEGQV